MNQSVMAGTMHTITRNELSEIRQLINECLVLHDDVNCIYPWAQVGEYHRTLRAGESVKSNYCDRENWMKKKPIPVVAPPGSSRVSKPSQNRTAFLLGLYVELPAVDAIVEPLVQLSDMLSISKLILLDSALARLGQYDAERSMFPPKNSMARGSLDPADRRQCSNAEFLLYCEHQKVRIIADNLWEGRTELAAWYRAGRAIGVLVNACDSDHTAPTPEAVVLANASLNQAASHWHTEIHPESGSGLAVWLSQWDGHSNTENAAAGKNKQKALKPKSVKPTKAKKKEPENKELRAVETLASEIQDRPEDTRSFKQRMRDDRDQFIYEMFFAKLDAAEIRELTNRKIKDETLPWEKLASKVDLRSIANLYAARFKKEQIPRGRPGRPGSKNRK